MPAGLQQGTMSYTQVQTPVNGPSITAQELEKLRRIEIAAKTLVEQKGRHNTEIAYQRLVNALHS